LLGDTGNGRGIQKKGGSNPLISGEGDVEKVQEEEEGELRLGGKPI